MENAFQALAIDDERKTFEPVLWDSQALEYQHIRQVWFAGMHPDIGGGYKEQELSDIPLVWMTSKAVSAGLRIYPKNKVRISENANGTMHNSRGTFLTKLYRRQPRSWQKNREDKPVVHQSVLARIANNQNKYRPWIVDIAHEVEPWVPFADQSWFS